MKFPGVYLNKIRVPPCAVATHQDHMDGIKHIRRLVLYRSVKYTSCTVRTPMETAGMEDILLFKIQDIVITFVQTLLTATGRVNGTQPQIQAEEHYLSKKISKLEKVVFNVYRNHFTEIFFLIFTKLC